MNRQACMVLVMVVSAPLVGCGWEAARPVTVVTKSPSITKVFRLKGVVRKVDASSGEITIAHEEIPSFMPKMTMPFTLKDKSPLKDVKAGDEVEGPLEVVYEGDQVKDVNLTGLDVTRSAPAESLALTVDRDPPPPQILKVGEPVPDFSVTTQEGKALKLSDLRGRVIVLTFIYTRCPSPEFCPAMDAKFAELARRISAVPSRSDGVRLLSVSFDPEHDTPEVLAAHAARRGAKPPLWTFAVASHDELDKVAGPLGLTYVAGTREIEHNLRAAVIGPDGKLVLLEVGPAWAPVELLKTVQSLIPSAAK